MHAPEFWRHNGLLARLLSPASVIWTARTAERMRSTAPDRVDIPVLCIGNVVAGGAGKTPVALAIAERLLQAGVKPHFLSRGYGGSAKGPVRVEPETHTAPDVGDEPLLLAACAPTWVARDRSAGAKCAAAAGADVILMDDGFQNPGLHKDFSILVIDGGYGFGNGRVMPAGPLREPVAAAMARADAVVIVGDDTAFVEKTVGNSLPVLTARIVPRVAADKIAGQRVVAFAGIGRPEKFFETLAGLGCDLVETRSFGDHHAYTENEVMSLIETAAAAQAIPVTTEKDALRLPTSARDMVTLLGITLEWGDETALRRALAPFLTMKA